MKNLYLRNGKRVYLGDVVNKVSTCGDITFIECVKIDDNTIPKLLEEGVIVSKPKEDYNKNPMDLEYYMQKIADRLNWKIEKVSNFLTNVDSIFPAAACSIILREIAVELDKKYEGHIEDSPIIYGISLVNGKIYKINKSNIKNYKNFAAFRTLEDARIAYSIVKDILKDMFKDNG